VTTLRPVLLPEDLEPLWEIALACEAAVIDEPTTTHEEVRSQLESPDGDLVDGTRVAVDDAGGLSGFLAVEVDAAARQVLVDAYARPGAGSEVLDLLLAHGVAYARRRAGTQDDATGWVAGGGAFPSDKVYIEALTNAGFRPVRRFHRMKVEVDPASPPEVPALPEGVRVTVVGEDEALQRAVHEVLEVAFEGHWRHTRHTWEDWIGYTSNRGYDPTQWWLATVDGEPAGAVVSNETLADVGGGYVSMLGVLEPYRGRGLGRGLLLTAFAEAARRGRTSVRLGVDTENGTGAPALYASVGMTPAEVIDAYELPLDVC
jgi:mycothiol synthase